MQTKKEKKWGEPGKIYHARNVIGRENLITLIRPHFIDGMYSFSHKSFMADRMGLDSTVALRGNAVSCGECT